VGQVLVGLGVAVTEVAPLLARQEMQILAVAVAVAAILGHFLVAAQAALVLSLLNTLTLAQFPTLAVV
jgi:hypothetical protein